MPHTNPVWRLKAFEPSDSNFWRRWDELLAAAYGSHAMLDSRFLRPAVEHFGQNKELQILSFGNRDSERAMMIVEAGRNGVLRSFFPSQLQVAPLLVAPDAALDIRSMFAALPWTCMRLDLLSIDPDYFEARLGPSESVERTIHAVTTSVRATRTFKEFWSARSKNLRHNIKRYRRRAEEEGHVPSLVVHNDMEAINSALCRYGDIESNGWKGRAGTAVHRDNVQGMFYADVLAGFAETSGATVFELCFGETVVASRLVIRSGRMAVLLKTTFDEAFAKYAPGRILSHEALAVLFELEGIETIETYTNAQKEQLEWADTTREIYNLSIYPRPFLRRGVYLSRMLLRRRSLPHNYFVDVHESFDSLPKASVKLWEDYGSRAPFAAMDWYRNLYQHAGHDLGELRILVLTNKAEEALAILPCVRSPSANASRQELSVLANYYSPSCELIVDEIRLTRDDAIARMLTAMAARSDWDGLSLFPAHDDAGLAAWRSAARQNLLPLFTFEETANWTQRIDNLEAYRAGLPPTLRSTLQRKGARLARAANAHYAVVTAPRDAALAVQDFNRIYQSSWKPHEPYSGFIEGLVGLAAQRGWLRLGLLYIDDKPIAGQIWIVNGGTASIYKLAYDNAYREYSPGTLLTLKLIEHVVAEDGVRVIDYLTGDDAYKRDWMSSRRLMYRVRIANPWRGRGRYLAAYDGLRKLKEVLLK